MTSFNRRKFLKAGFLSSAIFITSGCNIISITTPIETLKVMQNDLFPKAKQMGIDTSSYLHIVFHHPKITKEDKKNLKNGIKWLNEASQKAHKLNYTQLAPHMRQNILKHISKTRWGDIFIYNVMSYMFESMLGDPIYGGNKNEIAWKWLEFEGGEPRPKEVYI